jgi:hypothetical protein
MVSTQTSKGNGKQGAPVTGTKAKRGNGPVSFVFVDSEGKEHKRVPAKADHMVVVAGPHRIKFDPRSLDQGLLFGLACAGVAAKGKTYQINHGRKDGSDAHDIMRSYLEQTIAGKLVSRGVATKQGTSLDIDLIGEAMRLTYADYAKQGKIDGKGKPFRPRTDKEIADFKVKLATMDGTQRRSLVAGWHRDDVYVTHFRTLKRAKMGSDKTNVVELEMPL